MIFDPELRKEFDKHRIVSLISDAKSGLRGFISIHRGSLRVPAFGATRIYNYTNEREALKDALKLSRLMSYKAALAGLKYGGAKGVIIGNPQDTRTRKGILKAYSDKVNYYSGRFITGADVGIDDRDLNVMAKASPYMVGIKSDPVKYTASGLLRAIEVCLEEIYGSGSLAGRSFAIQGVGKIGGELLRLIYGKSGNIFVADIDQARLKEIKRKFPKVRVVPASEIHRQRVDIFSPNALSNSVNVKNIGKMRCEIIVGGANNQLENKDVGTLLYKLGILYAPDYVANAGGLISVVDEYEHKNHDHERIEKRVKNIRGTLKKILRRSSSIKRATNIVADELAEKIFNNH